MPKLEHKGQITTMNKLRYFIFSCMLSIAGQTLFAYDFEEDGIYYEMKADYYNEVSVTNNGNYNCYKGNLIIPNEVIHDGVTYSVTTIMSLQNCTSLISISVPSSVEYIDYSAFDGCDSLLYITIDPNNNYFDSHNDCNAIIETATNTLLIGSGNTIIPNEVTSISSHAFRKRLCLQSITIPENVANIGTNPFEGCKQLSSISVSSDNSIYDSRNECNAIIETSSNTLIAGCSSTKIPNSVQCIGNYAFCESGIKSIDIPEGVTSIDNYAICESNLKCITIPEGISTIGDYAFDGCYNLKMIINLSSNSLNTIGHATIYDCFLENGYAISIKDGKRYLCGYYGTANSLDVPNVDCVADYAFYNYQRELYYINLASVTNRITEIGEYAFAECPKLWQVFLGDYLLSIKSYAFSNCKYFWNASIPNSVREIGSYAFSGCTDLEKIEIGSGVKEIGNNAFTHCELLHKIYVSAKNKVYDSRNNCNAIIKTGNNTLVLGCKNTTIPNTVLNVGYRAFYGAGLTNIAIPDNVAKIDASAFSDCKKLQRVTISNRATCIGAFAFQGCVMLESISIPNGAHFVGESAFSGCKKELFNEYRNAYYIGNEQNPYQILIGVISNDATSFVIHENCKSVANYAISSLEQIQYNEYDNAYYLGSNSNPYLYLVKAKDKNIISCTIHDNCLGISTDAFSDCSKLQRVRFGQNVTVINGYAFSRCNNLTGMTFDNAKNLTCIGNDAFFACTGLSELVIPKSVKYINTDYDATGAFPHTSFNSCSNLTKISVEEGNEIYDSRDNCNAIIETASNNIVLGCEMTKIPESVSGIYSNAFLHCEGLIRITLPQSVSYIGSLAFQCNNLATFIVKSQTPFVIEKLSFVNRTNSTLFVPESSKSAYEAAEYWNEFKNILEVCDLDLIDGEPYSQTYDMETRVRYSRTFSNTNWQALYVPFSIPVDSLTKYGLKVAELNDTHQWDLDGDGTADSTRLEFFTLTTGSTEPNYPYLIKANETMELTLNLEDVEVKATEEKSYECSSLKQRFTFVGTYTGVSGADMYSNNYYGMAGGGLKRVADATVPLKPQRWYMKIENKNGSPVSYYAPSIRFCIDGIEDKSETTGITSIMSGNREEGENIFSLDGIRQTTGSLKPGLYVHQGKKLVIR